MSDFWIRVINFGIDSMVALLDDVHSQYTSLLIKDLRYLMDCLVPIKYTEQIVKRLDTYSTNN